MDAFRSSRQKRISRKQEKAVAKDLGGRTQAASGATRLGGGADVRAPGHRIECKYTEKDSYSLKKADLHKLKSQAVKTLENPVMQLAFLNNYGRRTEFAIVRTWNHPLNSNTGKSVLLILNQIIEVLRAGLDYRFRFLDDKESWRIRHWTDFIKDVEKE